MVREKENNYNLISDIVGYSVNMHMLINLSFNSPPYVIWVLHNN